jgi:hypothetical protein
MDLTMRSWDSNASMSGKFSTSTMVESFERKRVMDRGVRQPSIIVKRVGVLEANLVIEVGNMIGGLMVRDKSWTILQDGLNGPSVAIDVSKLTEAIFGDIIFGDGKGIIVQAKLRDSRDI